MGFEKVATLDQVPVDEGLAVTIGRLDLVLVREDNEVFALQNLCSHAAVALSEGEVIVKDGLCLIECFLHGSTFDCRTGQPTLLPATAPVSTFAVEVRNQDIFVDIDNILNGVTPS